MPVTPKNILYIRADSYGDLILFKPALSRLINAWKTTRHTILVRSGYESLKPLFSSGLDWRVTSVNPYKDSPAAARPALSALLTDLADNPPDLIVAAALTRTWLEIAIAARFPQARRVVLGHGAVDPLFARALEIELGEQAATAFSETIETDPAALDWENNHRLADHLLGQRGERSIPVLSVPAAESARATDILKAHNLAAGKWIACYPAGVANVAMKAWPAAKFAETIAWLHREHGLQVLLLGHRSEKAIVEETATLAAKAGVPRPSVWLSQDGEIALMAALLATAKLYLGNDTGPMHVSAGVGIPVVGIFGGGFWPRFKPVGRQVISVVQPLPCFGCGWDCHFGDAPCVKTLTVADVQAAVTRLLQAGTLPVDAVVEARHFGPETHALIAASTLSYRRLRQDRLDRQYKIEELTHLGREKDVEIADLKHAAEERKREMESIKAELEAECAQKDTEIGELKGEADTKDAEIASLKAETNTKDAEIASLKAEANTKDTEIEQLKATCNEREALIFRLTDIVKDFQKQVAGLQTALAGKDAEIARLTAAHEQLGAEFAQLRAHFAALPPDAAQYGQWLHDKDVHIRNLEVITAELRGSLENYASGHGELEQIKRYGKWLHEKEAVIRQLKRACDEREALIQQLAAKTAGLGRIHQAALAGSAYFRQKWWQPLRERTFKKLVEDHWMQLGVLRQYEPRPLAWDKKLPARGRLPDTALPTAVIVTPSYNQDKFLESTILSVLNQNYPKLRYRVQDGGSKDRSVAIIERYADRLAGWHSGKDRGQSDAIRTGFDQLPGGPDDVMAWLNSDDLIAPRALRFVAEYFVRHPQVDVVYGHRIIIDDHDREIGRWIMPPHDRASLEWIDYVPQETLYWRRRAWDAVGGLDPSFQFALDWDLLARFQQAGARIVRLPYFLGCFRLHSEQKTSAHIHTTGHEEMTRIRTRIHGPHPDPARIEHFARKARFQAALHSRLHGLGVRL